MKVLCLLFLVASSFTIRTEPTKSERRCLFAYYNLHTDNPPFNGKTVEVRFSEDYNQTELDETVQLLTNQGIATEAYTACAKRKHNHEDVRLKQTNLEEKCRKLYDEIALFNANQWFWQAKKSTNHIPDKCISFVTFGEKEESELVDKFPCAYLDCLRQSQRGPPGFVEPCVNKIIMFIFYPAIIFLMML